MTKLFGTNGIRGIVNKEMNCKLALDIGKAWGTYLKKQIKNPKVAIGYDARLSNQMLKSSITSGLLATGCNVTDIGLVPTPTLQYCVLKKKFDSGVMITASHNPPEFNGIKGIDADGTEFSKETEEEIEKIYYNKTYNLMSWKEVGYYNIFSKAIDLYIEGILSKINIESIKNQGFNIVLDCGNGAGSVVTPILLEKLGCKIIKLFCEPDGHFPGHESEPIPENLIKLIETVKENNVDFGIAQDGDADRAIFIDEKGNYVWGDQTLTLMAQYITKNKKNSIVVTPVTSSSGLEEIVNKNSGEVIYTKVGSPIVAREMIKQKAIFGGEENGGLIFPELQYCRDSAMTIVKMLELLSKTNKSFSDLLNELPTYEVKKSKIKCHNEIKEIVLSQVLKKSETNNDIIKVDKKDGVKIYYEKGWVLIRPSGTEPIFRIYSESKDKEITEKLNDQYLKLVEKIIKNI
jgi:phosphomannomutase/phosphoglucomutase